MHHYNHFYITEENKVVAETGKRSYLGFIYDHTTLLQDSKSSFCSNDLNNCHDKCVLENLEKAMEDKFGCHFFNSSKPEMLCNGRNVREEYKNGFKGEFFKLFKKVKMAFCPTPCKTMNIFYGIPVESQNDVEDEAYIKLYFKQQISSRKSTLSYDTDSVIADIGGYLGLLLGFSILDITMIIEKLLTKFHN